MGLDNLIDDRDLSTETKTKSKSKDSDLLEYKSYREENGEIIKNGPYGYPTMDDYENTIKGELQEHGELFKYHLPIFPHIEKTNLYEPQYRYRMEEKGTVVTCISSNETKLKSIPRDIIMIDTGHVERDKCMDELSNRLDIKATPYLKVTLYFFSNVRHIVKMAMADELTNDLSTFKIDMILKAVYDEQYTQKFREKHNEEMNLQHTDHIEPW